MADRNQELIESLNQATMIYKNLENLDGKFEKI
jgi:hypothetical protein